MREPLKFLAQQYLPKFNGRLVGRLPQDGGQRLLRRPGRGGIALPDGQLGKQPLDAALQWSVDELLGHAHGNPSLLTGPVESVPVTVYRKVARGPGSRVMAQPYAQRAAPSG